MASSFEMGGRDLRSRKLEVANDNEVGEIEIVNNEADAGEEASVTLGAHLSPDSQAALAELQAQLSGVETPAVEHGAEEEQEITDIGSPEGLEEAKATIRNELAKLKERFGDAANSDPAVLAARAEAMDIMDEIKVQGERMNSGEDVYEEDLLKIIDRTNALFETMDALQPATEESVPPLPETGEEIETVPEEGEEENTVDAEQPETAAEENLEEATGAEFANVEMVEGAASYGERLKNQVLAYTEQAPADQVTEEQRQLTASIMAGADVLARMATTEVGLVTEERVGEVVKQLEDDFNAFLRIAPSEVVPNEGEAIGFAEKEVPEAPEAAPNADAVAENLPVSAEISLPAVAKETLPAEISAYEQLRRQWLEARDYQKRAVEKYHEVVAEYYDSLKQETGWSKLKNRLKATFSIKPELPPEIQEERVKLFQITQEYNRLSREMMAARKFVGKEAAPPQPEGNELVTEEQGKRLDVLERYQKMYARASLVSMLEGEREIQEAAAEDLKILPPEFIRKNPKLMKAARYIGAAAIGGLSGGLVGGAQAMLRVVTGGALAGFASGFVSKKFDRRIDRIMEEEYATKIPEIGKKITSGGMSPEELQEAYNYLAGIYHKVDKENRNRILAILGTAVAVGAAAGFGIKEAFDSGLADVAIDKVGEVSTVAIDEAGEAIGVAGDKANEAYNVAFGPEGQTVPNTATGIDGVGAGTGAETVSGVEAMPTVYTAEAGDNFWDIMEGQTAAGKMTVMGMVPAEHHQALIDLTRDALNENDALRAEVGFGNTMDDLNEGAEVNLEKINEVATAIAEREGWLTATAEAANDNTAAEAATGVEDSEVPPAALDDVEGTEAAPAADASTEAAVVAEAKRVLAETAPTADQEVIAANDNFDGKPNNTYEYVRGYEGGYLQFEQDFQRDWVEKIQDMNAKKGGGIFGGGEPYMNAYHHFESMSIAQFSELSTLAPTELAAYLREHDINPSDYEAWNKSITEWQRDPNISFTKADRFEEVAKSAYIERVLEAKAKAA